MSEEAAARFLGLPPPDADGGAGFTEDQLKAAYRAAARKYHPDKNPAGAPMGCLSYLNHDRCMTDEPTVGFFTRV